MRKVIEVLLLQAIGYTHVQKGTTRAMTALGRALFLAQPEGYVRVFADEGPPMLSLLSAFRTFPAQQSYASQHDAQQYVEKLLTILEEDQSPARNGLSPAPKSLSTRDQLPVEPLSEREIEIMQFIAAGMSNLEIAQQMVITVGTVKWHLANIYGKLNVHSRTQALARSSDLGLLP